MTNQDIATVREKLSYLQGYTGKSFNCGHILGTTHAVVVDTIRDCLALIKPAVNPNEENP